MLLKHTFKQAALNGEITNDIMSLAEEFALKTGREERIARAFSNAVLELCGNIHNAYKLYGLNNAPSALRISAGKHLTIIAANYARPEDISRCRNAQEELRCIPESEALNRRNDIVFGKRERMNYSHEEMGGGGVGFLTLHGLGATLDFRTGKKDSSGAYRTLYSIARF